MKAVTQTILVFCLTVLSGCASHFYVAPQTIRFSSVPSDSLEIMTFNIRTKTFLDGFNGWRGRKDIVVDLLADQSSDIIGLQEVRYSQLKLIRTALPQYGIYAVGRSDGASGGESCPILYRKDRFTMADAGTFWFSDTPDVIGSKDWGNGAPRICSWARLVNTETGQGVYIYNLHLDNLSQNSREQSVKLLTRQVSNREFDDPFVVMGDFNMEPDNPAMQYMQNLALKNPTNNRLDIWRFIPHRTSAGTRHGFKGKESGPQIDHISISQSVQVTYCDVDESNDDGKYPSDHFPVVARILLGKQTAFNAPSASAVRTSGTGRLLETSL